MQDDNAHGIAAGEPRRFAEQYRQREAVAEAGGHDAAGKLLF